MNIITYFAKKVFISLFLFAFFLNPAMAEEKSAPDRINQGPAPADSKQGTEIFVQLGHTDGVYSVAFSPDGRYAFRR